MISRDRYVITAALCLFCIGDLLLLEDTPYYSFIFGLLLFLISLLLYSLYFYRETTYNIDRLLPFLTLALMAALWLIYMMYDGLHNLLVPIMLYLAVVLNLMKIAFLRYKSVNKMSYYLVFIGSLLFAIAQGIIGLHSFHKALPHKDIFIMLFYGVSQLLIILGILSTKDRIKYISHH